MSLVVCLCVEVVKQAAQNKMVKMKKQIKEN